MEAMEGAAIVLRKLAKLFHYKVKIFTYRPWPVNEKVPRSERKKHRNAWRKISWLWRLKGHAIRRHTLRWLRKNGIMFNKLYVERGDVHSSEPVSRAKNRFEVARRREIRLFVEDDLVKAAKLADICDIVFLIDHPYNQPGDRAIPHNLIRVSSWQEIYSYIKDEI